jgi:hypothetical protein
MLVCKPKRKTLFGRLDNAGTLFYLAIITFYVLCRLVYPLTVTATWPTHSRVRVAAGNYEGHWSSKIITIY